MKPLPPWTQTLHFAINRPPVSTNAQYGKRSGPGKGFYNNKEAKEFKEAVHSAAFAACLQQGWPKADEVEQVGVSIIVWGTKHDCSAADKLVCDGMEGVVYKNDKVAHPRTNDIVPEWKGPPRVEVTVTLLKLS